MRIMAVLAAGGLALLSGCGVIYTAPSVSDGGTFGEAPSTEYDVEIVRLTPESVRAANLSDYVPPRLPLAFQPGAAERVAQARIPSVTVPAAPAPSAQPQRRPALVPDRFPPLTPAQPYRIGTADVLLLSINQTATLEDLPALITAQAKRQGYVVQDDGAIAIPDVGRVQVGGLTLAEAEAVIFQALVSVGIDPAFSLEIAEFNSQRVSVGGEVRNPQLVPIGLKPLFLHEAIRLAGGAVSPDTDVAKVQLMRGGQVFQIGLLRFNEDPAARQIVLRDGDSVYVGSEFREQAAQVRFQEEVALRSQALQAAQIRVSAELQRAQIEAQREATAQARLASERETFRDRVALGAVARDHVYLTGEVIKRAARVPLPFETRASLADALFGAESLPIETADYAEIYVLRAETAPERAGGLTAFHLDAENAVNLPLAAQFELRPNDVIFVAEQPVTSWNRVISQILPSVFGGIAAGTISTF